MALSGTNCVRVTDRVKEVYQAMCTRGLPGEEHPKYAILKFIDESTLDVEHVVMEQPHETCSWQTFTDCLPRDQCRFALAKFNFTSQTDGILRPKLVLVMWAPLHGTTVKERMLTSMFSKGLGRIFDSMGKGLPIRIHADGVDALDVQVVGDKIRSMVTVK